MLFHIMFHCTIFYFFICIYCCFFVQQISCYYSKAFYASWYYIVTCSFLMWNKFINFRPRVNMYGLPLFWYSWQFVVMLFCFENALSICSKNVWNFPRQISFVNRWDILLQLNFSYLASYYLFWLYC